MSAYPDTSLVKSLKIFVETLEIRANGRDSFPLSAS